MEIVFITAGLALAAGLAQITYSHWLSTKREREAAARKQLSAASSLYMPSMSDVEKYGQPAPPPAQVFSDVPLSARSRRSAVARLLVWAGLAGLLIVAGWYVLRALF